MDDLAQPPTVLRVSSTLNNDVKQFGKKYLTGEPSARVHARDVSLVNHVAMLQRGFCRQLQQVHGSHDHLRPPLRANHTLADGSEETCWNSDKGTRRGTGTVPLL